MLTGENILCFGGIDWDFMRYPAKNTMLELSRTNRVLYVEPAASFLYPFREPYFWRRWLNLTMKIKRMNDNLYLWSQPPIFLPFITYLPLLPRLNGKVLSVMLNIVLKKLRFNDPILWSYFHYYEGTDVIPRVKSKFIVYDCIDEYSSYVDNPRYQEYIKNVERWLCENADIVFTVTKNLRDEKRRYNKHTYHVPNAVDLSYFNADSQRNPALSDMSQVRRPILGFIGLIDQVMSTDIELLHYIASSHPEWSIVLIGRIAGNLAQDFLGLKNVHFLGVKKVEELASYIRNFDVCLMPYLINDFTRNNSPLKLYEYLALGKPVVTTDIPACEEFRDLIMVSSDKDEFVSNISRALEENDGAAIERRILAARENTWERRVELKSMLIKRRMHAHDQRKLNVRSKN